jgi:hypothetical protein
MVCSARQSQCLPSLRGAAGRDPMRHTPSELAARRAHERQRTISAEAAPGAGTRLRGRLVDGMQSVLGQAREVASRTNPLPIIESIRRERSVHVVMDASHGRFFVTARRRSPIRGSMPVHVRSTLFIRMCGFRLTLTMSWQSDKYVPGHRYPRISIAEESP